MTLEYRDKHAPEERLSMWAVCWGSAAVACVLLGVVSACAVVFDVRAARYPYVLLCKAVGVRATVDGLPWFTGGLLAAGGVFLVVGNPTYWGRALKNRWRAWFDRSPAQRWKGAWSSVAVTLWLLTWLCVVVIVLNAVVFEGRRVVRAFDDWIDPLSLLIVAGTIAYGVGVVGGFLIGLRHPEAAGAYHRDSDSGDSAGSARPT